MKFVFTTGKRLDSRLIYAEDKQLYRIRSKEASYSKYVCYRPTCKARIIVHENTCYGVPNFDQHNHTDDQESEFSTFDTERRIKLRCQEDKVTRTKEIISSLTGSSNVSYERIRSAMNFNRKINLPTNPTTLDEAISFFDNDNVKNIMDLGDGSIFFHKIVAGRGYSFVIFKCKKILQNLPDTRLFHITSSLRTITSGFFKVLITFSIMKEAQVKIEKVTKENLLQRYFVV